MKPDLGGLKKKVGPLPLWVWLVLLGGGIGLYLRQKNKAGATGAATPNGQIDPATGVPYALEGTGTGAYGPIDPNTGIPFQFEAGQSGGALSDPFQGIADTIGLIQALKDAGLWPADPAAAGATTPAKAKAKAQKGKAKKATSTGAGASAGGHPHTASPHPKHRIGLAGNKAVGHTPAKAAPPRRPEHTVHHNQPAKRGARR